MQPYVNPNYFNGYQTANQFQPYTLPSTGMDRANLYITPYPQIGQAQPGTPQQQINQQANPAWINGKFVNSFNEITANDVPMNGTYAIFPKTDLSEIQVRTWSADGKIVPVVFKPVLDTQAINSSPEPQKAVLGLSDEATGAFMKRFDDIANRLDVLEDIWSKQTSRSGRSKKEADAE